MPNLVKISPSIIATNYTDKQILNETLLKLKEAKVELLHLDVMDGKFVKNKTFDHTFVEYIKNVTNFILDVHLMVKDPELVVEDYLNAGADILYVHYEATKQLEEVLDKIKGSGVLSGVSIKVDTPVDVLKPYLDKGLIDVILVMSVEPGECGQQFNSKALEKITYFKKFYPKVDIEVDGGINLVTAKDVIKAGADLLVSGSAIFNSGNLVKVIKELRKSK